MTGSDRDGLAAIEAPPQPGRRVLLGLSGGVDSSVAALLLKEQGYEVIAARMRVYDGPNDPGLSYGCYGRSSADDERSAEALAGRLGLDFHILQCSGPWRDYVLEYFRREYLAGRTPNPCIRCNEMVKFGFLPLLARKKGIEFDYFATGHYARIEKDLAGNWITLKRGRDPRKDQSYFLYRLSREQLGRIIFPLGDFNKEEVRALAKERQLASHDRPDSQDFYGSDYSALINAPERGGHIVDSSGRAATGAFGIIPPASAKAWASAGQPPYTFWKSGPKPMKWWWGRPRKTLFRAVLSTILIFYSPGRPKGRACGPKCVRPKP